VGFTIGVLSRSHDCREAHGDEETKEASGGYGQGEAGKAKAKEEDLAREVGRANGVFELRKASIDLP
jgi:hypothetical protein